MQAETFRELLRPRSPQAEAGRPEVLVIAAHPDDEIIGAGAALGRIGSNAIVLHITDGAPRDMVDASAAGFRTREAYALARMREANAALDIAGVSRDCRIKLGVTDQDASMDLAGITRKIRDIVLEVSPKVILTHPYEGGHPDHDAAAFCANTAAAMVRAASFRSPGGQGPAVWEMGSYHGRATLSGDMEMAVFDFFPARGRKVFTLELSPSEREMKERMFRCFMTQHKVLQAFPLEKEIFRAAPLYEFTLPPFEGRPYYESFQWGMTLNKWLRLVRTAIRDIESEGMPPYSPGPGSFGNKAGEGLENA